MTGIQVMFSKKALLVVISLMWGVPTVASTEKQSLLTFNVPSEVQEKTSTLMEGSGVHISSAFHPLNSDVMVYVIGSPS